MKSPVHKSKRITVSALHEMLQQTNAKIDILEDRLREFEVGDVDEAQAESEWTEAFDDRLVKARERIVLVRRASSTLWKGLRTAGGDVKDSFDTVFSILRNGTDDAGRDMETTLKRSKAAIQGGLAKARQDVDKSAKVAMHIVNS